MNHSQDSFSTSLTSLGAELPAGSPVQTVETRGLAIIDPRSLERECLVRCVDLVRPDIVVAGYNSLADWRAKGRGLRGMRQVILFSTANRPVQEVAADIRATVAEAAGAPVVVIGMANDLREMLTAFDCGARAYLPSSVGIDEIIETTRLASFGGIFLPMACLEALRDALPDRTDEPRIAMDDSLTERQRAVCDALRRGKSNKIIASELNLCESTVKVHIRNIMKKLGVKNRTEAAFKLNSSFFAEEGRLT